MNDSDSSLDLPEGAPTALILADGDNAAAATPRVRGPWVLEDLTDDELVWLGRS